MSDFASSDALSQIADELMLESRVCKNRVMNEKYRKRIVGLANQVRSIAEDQKKRVLEELRLLEVERERILNELGKTYNPLTNQIEDLPERQGPSIKDP